MMVELIRLTHDNLETERICCAISNNKDVQVISKKAWLPDRLDEGLVFLKGDVRGKCFIENMPLYLKLGFAFGIFGKNTIILVFAGLKAVRYHWYTN